VHAFRHFAPEVLVEAFHLLLLLSESIHQVVLFKTQTKGQQFPERI